MTERLIDFILDVGIKNRFFIHYRHSDTQEDFQIYQVKGHSGIGQTIPQTLVIDICMYNLRNKNVSRHNKYLGSLLEDEIATAKEIDSIPKELRQQAEELQKSKEKPYSSF